METVLFTLGDYAITLGYAIAGGVGLIGLLLVVVLIATMRASAAQADIAAAAAADQLRASLMTQIGERDSRIDQLQHAVHLERERASDALLVERDKNSELLAEVSALRARMAEQTRQSETNLARFLDARQQMTDEFKAIAGDVLKTHGETFSKQNREQVDVLLKPQPGK